MYPTNVQTIHYGNRSIDLLVPNQVDVKKLYKALSEENPNTHFPFWTQVWPSAIAMAQFIVQENHRFLGKHVTELAAGLGLPSFVVSKFANQVYCTDYLQEAVEVMEKSITYHGIKNINCGIIDWNNMPTDLPKTEIVLVSDVNYNPVDFEILYQVLIGFLQKDCTLILTTPQRLLAKPFIERLLPFCDSTEEITIIHFESEVKISILVLSCQS